jgi:hypothetical protein
VSKGMFQVWFKILVQNMVQKLKKKSKIIGHKIKRNCLLYRRSPGLKLNGG